MTRARVLIVDDSPANLKLARIALEGADLDLATASDAEEAQHRLVGFHPDLILMDLQLPGMDGYTLTRSLKAEPRTAHICVVAVTAYAMKGDHERALEAGCDGYITKPVDPLLLPGLVTAHLAQMRSQQASLRATPAPTVLVVDDNPAARKLLRIAFESEGIRVHEAEDARGALTWLEHGRPQLIVQDLVLPDLDGVTLLQRIRELDHARDLPVVCLSGFVDRMTAARTMDNGFAATLLKPVDPLALLELVRTQLCMRDAQPPASTTRVEEVLIVDNDALQLRLAKYQLAGAGLHARTADDPRQALASAIAAPPVAIICNVQLPGMNGFELCMNIRQTQALAHVAVILVASHSDASDSESRKLAKELGADAFTEDGHNWKNTLKLLREVLAQRQRGTLGLSPALARDRILRCIQAQLDRQLHANASLVQRCLLQAAQLSVLAGVADSLARDETAVDSLSDVLAVSLDLAGIAKGALYLYRDGRLQPRDALGFSAAERAALSDCFGYVETVERLTTHGQVLRITRAEASDDRERGFLARAGLQSAIIAPVAWRDHYYGALLLGSDRPEVAGHEPTAFARVLGSQVGQAIGLADAFERLHSSEERFRALVDSMDSVVVADRDRRITGTYGREAPTGEPVTTDPSQTGVAQNWVGQPLEALWDEPRTENHRDAYTRALSGERVAYEWTRGVGIEARHFREALWPVRDAHGVVQSVMCVARETTAEKRLQAQVMVSDRMASVGMLAAGVAHEINNPLMAVLGNLQLALDGLDTLECLDAPQTGDMQQSLFDAFDAAKRVDAIVRDLRLFSRSDEESDSVDVHGVLESTLRMARAAIRDRAHITRQYAAVPLVEASESRLGQVFLNLIINAAQALPEGDADTQEIRVSTLRQPDGRVRVEITDTGCGIPPEVARRLFTPFLTTKPVGVGTGLGLTICQRIVQALGGEISFESVVGRGTTFRVVLPPARRARVFAPPRSAPKPALRRGRVLIIDDELIVGSMLAKSLGRDHETVHDTDARCALARLRADPNFDVILCDLMMPKMGGAELYEALVRELPALAARVIFLTGGAFTDATNEFLEHIPNLHLRKPVNMADLRGAVNERVGA